jgi:hypothetical protein
MKELLRTRPIWILVLSPILAAVLLTLGYAAIAKSRHADVQQTNSIASVSSIPQPIDFASRPDDDDDPALIQKRREYLDRVHGSVSPAAFATALAATRALPPSPLPQGADSPGPLWTLPVPPPIWNDWGNGASARIDAIATHPTNADIVYIGSEGGLSKSTDGGTHWNYISDNLSSQSIRSLALDQIAPNILYAGTGTSWVYGVGIYRSLDSGATWQPFGQTDFGGGAVNRIAIDPSTAGSQTSTKLYASFTKAGFHSVWRSTDSGSHWTNLRTVGGAGGFYDIAIDPAAPSTFYVTAPDGVFKVPANGRWIPIHTIHPTQAGASSYLAIAQSVLYLAFRNASGVVTVEKSTDQGSNWTPLTPPNSDLACFGVDPAHPNRIFIGGQGDLRYSLDSGASWANSGGVHVDMHSIAFCPSSTNRNYLGTDGGIYRADYTGSGPIFWDSKNQNLVGVLMQGLSLSNDGHMVMGTQDNGTQIYLGGTSPWTTVYGGDGWKAQIDPVNSNKLYYVYYIWPPTVRADSRAPFRVFYTSGLGCCDKTPPGAINEYSAIWPALFMAPNNSNRVLIGFQNAWRSSDSGDSWLRIGGSPCINPPTGNCGIDPDATIISLYEAPSNTQIIYATTRGGQKVFVTTNANNGNSAGWTDITRSGMQYGLPVGTVINGIAVHPNFPSIAYLACATDVYKTTDTGVTWSNLTAPSASNLIYTDLAIDPANGNHPDRLFAASYAGVRSSLDGGGTWQNMSTGIPVGMSINTLSFNPATCRLAASTYGRGAYVAQLDCTAPTVSITAPANGATVAGQVIISATASDNVGVAGVRFKVDGINLEPEDTVAPYSVNWNTYVQGTGNHILTAVARDGGGNTTTSAPVTVKVVTND